MYWENKHGIELDFYSQMIKSMHDATGDVVYDRRLREKNFGTEPIFWHFNGGGKSVFPKVEEVSASHRQ